MSNPINTVHFGTLLYFYNLFCWPLFFVMCLVLLPTSHIIGRTLSWLLHGFLNSRTALSLTLFCKSH